jgi:hypothetical protein
MILVPRFSGGGRYLMLGSGVTVADRGQGLISCADS